jgi:hypothetical protein
VRAKRLVLVLSGSNVTLDQLDVMLGRATEG